MIRKRHDKKADDFTIRKGLYTDKKYTFASKKKIYLPVIYQIFYQIRLVVNILATAISKYNPLISSDRPHYSGQRDAAVNQISAYVIVKASSHRQIFLPKSRHVV